MAVKQFFFTKTNRLGNNNVGFSFTIGCQACDVELPKEYKTDFYLSIDGTVQPEFDVDERNEAIEAWNRRENQHE